MAYLHSDFNEDDGFEEYNPDPYHGGYDIALTYGQPLPPSPAICYPLFHAPSPPPSSPPPRPEPAEEPTAIPAPHGGGDEFPEPEPDQNPPPEPYSSDLLGHWPFLTPEDDERSHWRDRSEEPGYWRQWRRAADYLFGYSSGYGERRVGIDSYGIPIYAYRRHSEQPLAVQVEPTRSHKLDYHEAHGERAYPIHSEDWSSAQSEGRDEKDFYEKALCVHADPIEPSYDEVYEDQIDPWQKWSSSSYDKRVDEIYSFETPNYAYDKHYYAEPLHLQLDTVESHKLSYPIHSEAWSSAQSEGRDEKDYYEKALCVHADPIEPSYDEVYEDQIDPWQKWSSSSYDKRVDEIYSFGTPNYAYDKHYYEEPLHLQLDTVESHKLSYYNVHQEHASSETNWHSSSNGEPLEPIVPAWSRNPSHYGVYNEELSPESKWQSSTIGEPLEPFEPSWSRYPSYYGDYSEELSLESKGIFPSYSERGAESDVFWNPGVSYERHYHEEPLSVQLPPFNSTWSQNPINYDVYKEKVDDSYEEIAAQFFCPFQKYSSYDDFSDHNT